MAESRKLVIGLLLVALAAASWWFTRDAAPPFSAKSAKARHDPDYIIEKFTATAMNERGLPRYLLVAEQLTHYPDDDTAHLVKPVLTQFQPQGVRVVTRSDAGVMPGDGREIVMTGNVQVTRNSGAGSAGGEILTDRLRVELDRD